MNYKDKQDWLDAVMASDLSNATKVYAYGIFKHMYGVKDDAFPGAKAIAKATGLNDGHYYKYNKALKEAGFIEVTSRRGTSNEYRLSEPTSTGGNYLPPQEVRVPREEVRVTSTGGTNTTSNTTKDTTMEDNKTEAAVLADAPTSTSLNSLKVKEESKELGKSRYSFELRNPVNSPNYESVGGAFYAVDLGLKPANEVTAYGGNPQAQEEFQIETEQARVQWLLLHRDEKAFFERVDATQEQKDAAVVHYRTGDIKAASWTERANTALSMAGVDRGDDW